VGLAGVVLYFLGSLHPLLYPAVTVSTGESKPRGTYFEENSLLPGLASQQFQVETDPLGLPGPGGRGQSCAAGCGLFHAEGLACWRLPTTNSSSLALAVAYGRRSDQKEHIVLSFSCDEGSDSCPRHVARFAAYLNDVPWLAKDVLLLLQTRASSQTSSADALEVVGRSLWSPALVPNDPVVPWAGVARAALHINLEACALPRKADLHVVGENARLPNMDLVNLVANSFGTNVGLKQRRLGWFDRGWEWCLGSRTERHALGRYAVRLRSMVSFAMDLVLQPHGEHRHFMRHGVESLTIDQCLPEDADQVTRIFQRIESVVRSLNNLEERLHHGFFLYMLMTLDHFVSIGEYAITLALFTACHMCIALPAFHKVVLDWFIIYLVCACALVVGVLHKFRSPVQRLHALLLVLLFEVVFVVTSWRRAGSCRWGALYITTIFSCCLCAALGLLCFPAAVALAITTIPLLLFRQSPSLSWAASPILALLWGLHLATCWATWSYQAHLSGFLQACVPALGGLHLLVTCVVFCGA